MILIIFIIQILELLLILIDGIVDIVMYIDRRIKDRRMEASRRRSNMSLSDIRDRKIDKILRRTLW